MDNKTKKDFLGLLIKKSCDGDNFEIIKIEDSMTKEEMFEAIDKNFNILLSKLKDKIEKDTAVNMGKLFFGSVDKNKSCIVGEGGPEIDHIFFSKEYIVPEDGVKLVVEKSEKGEKSSKEKIFNILNLSLNEEGEEEERFMAENNPEMFLPKINKDLNRIKYSARDGEKTFNKFLRTGKIDR